MRINRRGVLIALSAGVLLFWSAACTMTLNVAVRDENGNPVPNVVVFASPVQGGVPRELSSGRGMKAGIEVKDQKIVPVVLPVRVGSSVSFHNRDDIQHHIYSISPAKNFELTLDKGACSPDIVFDKPGLVVTGSASNDRMIGFIYVLSTPWFRRTGPDGKAELSGLPRRSYDVRIWHPAMRRSPETTTIRVAPSSGRGALAGFTLMLPPVQNSEPVQPSPPPPAAGGR